MRDVETNRFAVSEVVYSEDDQVPQERLDFRSPHDVRWDSLGPADASAVREALVQAHKLRQVIGAPLADSYLQAFALNRAT